ncbi:MAG: hypothetical protein Q7S19_04030 [bacterium]|nr:hypothetical protein [bacterium]
MPEEDDAEIISHVHQDPDSRSSIWAVRKCIPRLKDARVVLVSGRWNGEGMKSGSLAVDIPIGIKGEIQKVEGQKRIMNSALKSVVSQYATARQAAAIKYFVEYINVLDSRGSPTNHLIPHASGDARRIFSNVCFDGVMRAFERIHSDNEEIIFSRISEILDGIYEMGLIGIPLENGISRDVADYLLSSYRQKTDAVLVKEVIRFFDLKAEHGHVADLMISEASEETRKIFSKNSIDAVFAALLYVHRNDTRVFFGRAFEILDGFIKMDEMSAAAEAAADLVPRYTDGKLDPNGKVAFVKNRKQKGVGYALRKRGVVIVVYVDGINIGVVVKGRPRYLRDGTRLTAGHPIFEDIVKTAGDPKGLWYLHIAEFLFCDGSEKAPTDTPSNVDPMDFVRGGCELVNQLRE